VPLLSSWECRGKEVQQISVGGRVGARRRHVGCCLRGAVCPWQPCFIFGGSEVRCCSGSLTKKNGSKRTSGRAAPKEATGQVVISGLVCCCCLFSRRFRNGLRNICLLFRQTRPSAALLTANEACLHRNSQRITILVSNNGC